MYKIFLLRVIILFLGYLFFYIDLNLLLILMFVYILLLVSKNLFHFNVTKAFERIQYSCNEIFQINKNCSLIFKYMRKNLQINVLQQLTFKEETTKLIVSNKHLKFYQVQNLHLQLQFFFNIVFHISSITVSKYLNIYIQMNVFIIVLKN